MTPERIEKLRDFVTDIEHERNREANVITSCLDEIERLRARVAELTDHAAALALRLATINPQLAIAVEALEVIGNDNRSLKPSAGAMARAARAALAHISGEKA